MSTVSNSGSLTALGGFTRVPTSAGLNYAYSSGGFVPSSTNIIDRFPLATPFTTATDAGDLTQARHGSTGHSSDTDGYVSGGINPSIGGLNTIDKFPFSSPFATATNVTGTPVSLTAFRTSHSTATEGFSSGGRYYPPAGFSNTYQNFPFSSPTVVWTQASTLTVAKNLAAGQTSSTDGYVSGGTLPAFTNVIEKFPFSSPFAAATDVGDLTQARSNAAGISSDVDGYTYGGNTPTLTNTIDKFPFSTPFATATDVGDAVFATGSGTGHSSLTDGYVSGADPVATPSIIHKFPFSTPFTTATNVGSLTSNRSYVAGQVY
jgi:hypothetical protein